VAIKMKSAEEGIGYMISQAMSLPKWRCQKPRNVKAEYGRDMYQGRYTRYQVGQIGSQIDRRKGKKEK
jgi:hypothetical protein